MIAVLLRDLAPRLLFIALAMLEFYRRELDLQHHAEELPPEMLSPAGIAATLSYVSGLAVIVLLAGFVSTDRRRGYAEIYFSHPTRPLALYGLRWLLAVGLALGAALLFLVLWQLGALGGFRGGWHGLSLALLSALVYGGLMAFFSVLLRRGDVWVGLLAFFPALSPGILVFLQQVMSARGYQLLLFLLPPQWAFQDVYAWIVGGAPAWGAAAYAAGYGLFWLGAAAALLAVREWR